MIQSTNPLQKLQKIHSYYYSLQIRISLTTGTPDGLLLWMGRRQQDFVGYYGSFLALFLEGGFVKLRLNFGTDSTVEFSAEQLGRVDDGQSHNISLTLAKNAPTLDLDGRALTGPPYGDTVYAAGNPYVGGLPDNSAIMVGDAFSGGGSVPSGLRGCIHFVAITEESTEPFPVGKTTVKEARIKGELY
jgi:hypothetical protein